MRLTILYRGPLASCNYACGYCPFAKRRESAAEHAVDARALARFVGWVEARTDDQLAIFFTPWGEALIRARYRQAITQLTNLPHVVQVAAQTNLTGRLAWVEDCDKSKLALWTTYHPSQVSRAVFLARCHDLERRGVRFSVGVVGLKDHADEIEELRRELPPRVYLWINAYKNTPTYYTPEEIDRLTATDPLFPINAARQPSLGRACRTGHSVITVDGDGTIRRCQVLRAPLGNIYEPGFEQALRERPCPRPSCGCHIGYVHLEHLGLDHVFGDGLLARIPTQFDR